MDVKTYATVTDVCARLAGRLADDTLRSVREDYFGGEPAQAEATLLLSMAYENIGITAEERDLIASTLDDPNSDDLAAVPSIDDVPPVPYRFSAQAPASAPDASSTISLTPSPFTSRWSTKRRDSAEMAGPFTTCEKVGA